MKTGARGAADPQSIATADAAMASRQQLFTRVDWNTRLIVLVSCGISQPHRFPSGAFSLCSCDVKAARSADPAPVADVRSTVAVKSFRLCLWYACRSRIGGPRTPRCPLCNLHDGRGRFQAVKRAGDASTCVPFSVAVDRARFRRWSPSWPDRSEPATAAPDRLLPACARRLEGSVSDKRG